MYTLCLFTRGNVCVCTPGTSRTLSPCAQRRSLPAVSLCPHPRGCQERARGLRLVWEEKPQRASWLRSRARPRCQVGRSGLRSELGVGQRSSVPGDRKSQGGAGGASQAPRRRPPLSQAAGRRAPGRSERLTRSDPSSGRNELSSFFFFFFFLHFHFRTRGHAHQS